MFRIPLMFRINSQSRFALFFFFYYGYLGIVSPYLSLYFDAIGFTAIQISLLMSMLQITRIMGPFAWGWLADFRQDRIGITPADQIADHTQCHLRLWVNEEKKQDTLVADLIFNVPELIEYLSRRMTLRPGDVIATGTPAGVGRPKGTFLKPGDTVRIEISGLGVLQNQVVQGQ